MVQFVQKLILWVIWVSLDQTVRALSLNTRQQKVINAEKINTPQAGGQKSTPARLKKSKKSKKSKKKRKKTKEKGAKRRYGARRGGAKRHCGTKGRGGANFRSGASAGPP